jgi:hypothetical protein
MITMFLNKHQLIILFPGKLWGYQESTFHRDRIEHTPFVVLFIFSSFEHVKKLLIMGPNNTKNSSLKCDFLIINYKYYCQNLVFIVKNAKFDQKNSFFALCQNQEWGP